MSQFAETLPFMYALKELFIEGNPTQLSQLFSQLHPASLIYEPKRFLQATSTMGIVRTHATSAADQVQAGHETATRLSEPIMANSSFESAMSDFSEEEQAYARNIISARRQIGSAMMPPNELHGTVVPVNPVAAHTAASVAANANFNPPDRGGR